MNGAYQIINFDDIEFTTGTAELVVGAYKKITDTAKRFVITHLNLDEEVYKDIQLTFENVDGTFVGTGVVNGKLAVVSIASTDQVTVSLNDITGGITSLQNALAVTDAKFNYSTTEQVVGKFLNDTLYRKVKQFNYSDGTFLPAEDSLYSLGEGFFSGNEKIIKVMAMLKYSATYTSGPVTEYIPIPTPFTGASAETWTTRLSNINPLQNNVRLSFGTGWRSDTRTNLEITLIFEYTKTTP